MKDKEKQVRRPAISAKTQSLRNKIVVVSITILICIFLFIILLTRGTIDYLNNKDADNDIHTIYNFYKMTDETNTQLPLSPYFIVVEGLNTKSVDLSNSVRMTQAEASKLHDVSKLMAVQKGTTSSYRFNVFKEKDSTVTIFLYIGQITESKNVATGVLLIILLSSLLLLSIITSVCANFIIAPFVESAEQQRQFIADASHDLKTPLAVIMSNIDVVEMSVGKSKWTSNIKKESKRMAELIDDMLTLSKLESFSEKTMPISVNISDILNEMVSEFDPMWKERKISVIKKVNDKLIKEGSPQQITRLFRTIMQNATKYCTEGGRFELSAKKIKGKIVVTMYNTAELDPNIDYNKLFERFYRGDSSRNSHTGGHGIGLSIAKKICELENYQIKAEKTKQGIAFIITL